MLRPADRLAVGMPQVPLLVRGDEAADELAVHELRPQAGWPASTPHSTASNKRRPRSPTTTMDRIRVQRSRVTRPRQPPTPRRTKPLMVRRRHVRARATVTASNPQRHPSRNPRPADAARSTEALIAVPGSKDPGTAFARSKRHSSSSFHGEGRSKTRGHLPSWRHARPLPPWEGLAKQASVRRWHGHRLRTVRHWLGAAFVIFGFAVLALDVSYLDVAVLTVTPGHGVELSDLIGAAALLAGVITLW